MVTLAEFRRLALADQVDLLKVDIEGAEIELFSACDNDELRDVMQITVRVSRFRLPRFARFRSSKFSTAWSILVFGSYRVHLTIATYFS